MTIRCRACNELITSENDSEAHIIPNALGGRLKPKGILCRTCNSLLDEVADNSLIEAFGAWPTLLDIPRQRGKNPPKMIETRNGKKVQLASDGTLKCKNVQYEVSQVPEGQTIQIGAGDMKTFRELLKRAAKEFSQFDRIKAEQYARNVGIDADDDIKLSVNFSPAAVFGGVITAIWLFLIKNTGHSFMDRDRLLACIKEVQQNGGTFRYFINGLPGLSGPDVEFGHKIVVRAVPSSGELIAYVELLGILKVGGVFAKAKAPTCSLEHIYAYDLKDKVDLSNEYSIDSTIFDHQDWHSVGVGPQPQNIDSLRKHFSNALDILTNYYSLRFS